MTDDADHLAAYLKANCRGRAAAIPKWRIQADLAARGITVTDRNFDLAAEDLALTTGDVGSSAAGFFWCIDPEDYDLAYDWLVGRFAAQRTRAERLKARKRERFAPLREFLFNPWMG